MSRSGIVNVRMVITEEKILSNIEKVHKMKELQNPIKHYLMVCVLMYF